MQTIDGFEDRFGAELRRRRYLAATFGRVAESFGYEPLEVPIVEHASAYDEKVVGLSPWPEWNPAGVFSLSLPRFSRTYDEADGEDRAVLIPEGTLSVTRWLAARLAGVRDPANAPQLPCKVYYEVSCYRNELLSTLSATKSRQFTQFGVEILGSGHIVSELEAICVAAEALHALGVQHPAIAFRVSSNGLFSSMATSSGLSHRAGVALKELLDTLAECKAGKRPERWDATRQAVRDLLDASAVPAAQQRQWDFVCDRPMGAIDDHDHEILAEHAAHLERIQTIGDAAAAVDVQVDIDFCVVRSHEYYTGITFEIDLIGPDGSRAVEVGGGGRYDRLMGNFLEAAPGATVPCAGYAFGLERLSGALARFGLLGDADGANLSDEAAPTVPMTDPTPHGYVADMVALRERRRSGRASADIPR